MFIKKCQNAQKIHKNYVKFLKNQLKLSKNKKLHKKMLMIL